jgi:hypothetical protein
MENRTDDLAPETANAEQDDASQQAQTVAQQAEGHVTTTLSLGESERAKGGIEGADEQDLVDHMRQMDTSGIIDMSAYRGEDNHDDLEVRYGRASVPDEGMENDDS